MSLLTKGLLALVAVLALAVGIQTWRVHAHQNDAVEAAVAPAKAQAVSAAAKVETVTVALAAERVVVTRTIHDTTTVPANVLHPVTPADTASAVAALPIVKAERDSIARSCSAYVVSCDDYRHSAENRFRADAAVISTQDALLKSRPPKKNWHLGVGPGYGLCYDRRNGRVFDCANVSATLTWTPF